MSEPQTHSLPTPAEAAPQEVGRRLRSRRLAAVKLRFAPSSVREIALPGEIPETRPTDQAWRRDAIYRRMLGSADRHVYVYERPLKGFPR